MANIIPITPDDFRGSDHPYTPSGELHKFTGAASLDAHFTSHGMTMDETEGALDKLMASAPAPAYVDWNKLVTGRAPSHMPIAQAMNLASESKQIEDLAWQLVARARRANLVLTIETSRHPDNDKEMGNYSLAVELRPSLTSIREKAARRALHDAEFERNELGLEPQT